jgi:Na+/H+ antiporter NhaC
MLAAALDVCMCVRAYVRSIKRTSDSSQPIGFVCQYMHSKSRRYTSILFCFVLCLLFVVLNMNQQIDNESTRTNRTKHEIEM